MRPLNFLSPSFSKFRLCTLFVIFDDYSCNDSAAELRGLKNLIDHGGGTARIIISHRVILDEFEEDCFEEIENIFPPGAHIATFLYVTKACIFRKTPTREGEIQKPRVLQGNLRWL